MDRFSPQDFAVLGLQPGEAALYIGLLKIGPSTVAELSKAVPSIHRTNIYDVLQRLQEKGLVSQFRQDGTMVFEASDPATFLRLHDERQTQLEQLIPKLQQLRPKPNQETIVEVFKGEQGLKNVLAQMLEDAKDVMMMGVAGKLSEKLPNFLQYYDRMISQRGIRHRFIYQGGEPPAHLRHYDLRHLEGAVVGPSTLLSYDSVMLHFIWEPDLVVVRVRNPSVAEAWQKSFEALWERAKPYEPDGDVPTRDPGA